MDVFLLGITKLNFDNPDHMEIIKSLNKAGLHHSLSLPKGMVFSVDRMPENTSTARFKTQQEICDLTYCKDEVVKTTQMKLAMIWECPNCGTEHRLNVIPEDEGKFAALSCNCLEKNEGMGGNKKFIKTEKWFYFYLPRVILNEGRDNETADIL